LPLSIPFTCQTTVVPIFETGALSDFTSPEKRHTVTPAFVARCAMSELEVHALPNFLLSSGWAAQVHPLERPSVDFPQLQRENVHFAEADRTNSDGDHSGMVNNYLQFLKTRRPPTGVAGLPAGLGAGRLAATLRHPTECKRSEPTPHLPRIDRREATSMAQAARSAAAKLRHWGARRSATLTCNGSDMGRRSAVTARV
jgi:hypothetical protein